MAIASQRKKGWISVLNRIPQLINQARVHLAATTQMLSTTTLVGYEPLNLKLFVNTPYYPNGGKKPPPLLTDAQGRKMDLDGFRFVLDQVPAIQSVEFGGYGEPMLLADIFKMIDLVASFNGATTTLTTDGFLLEARKDALLSSYLDKLIVRMHAHRPSAYGAITGRPPQEHPMVAEQLKKLVAARNTAGSPLKIHVQMTVDLHNYQTIPDMLAYCQSLGVDGVIFENYLGEEPTTLCDRSLYTDQVPIVRFLRELAWTGKRDYHLEITWPVLLDPSRVGLPGQCRDPFTLVGLDTDCSVTGCSRQLIAVGKGDKIWEADFWNSNTYQLLREVNEIGSELPAPCRVCPKNIGTKLLHS